MCHSRVICWCFCKLMLKKRVFSCLNGHKDGVEIYVCALMYMLLIKKKRNVSCISVCTTTSIYQILMHHSLIFLVSRGYNVNPSTRLCFYLAVFLTEHIVTLVHRWWRPAVLFHVDEIRFNVLLLVKFLENCYNRHILLGGRWALISPLWL